MKNNIPEPITFNPYKHHYYFIKEQIRLWKKEGEAGAPDELLKLGDNLLDLYFGPLTIAQICDECITFLLANQILAAKSFREWIKPYDYKKIQLSDHSFWIVKQGDSRERYVHIHPAKNSVYTNRVRATTLKTVIALRIQKSSTKNMLTLKEVNDIRIDALKLSPVKKLEQGKGILKLWQFFIQT